MYACCRRAPLRSIYCVAHALRSRSGRGEQTAALRCDTLGRAPLLARGARCAAQQALHAQRLQALVQVMQARIAWQESVADGKK